MDDTRAAVLFRDSNIGISAIQRIVTEKYAVGEALLVREVFTTVQGEMPFAGHPAVFLRLGGCNRGAKDQGIACQACDTSFEVSKSEVITVDNFLKQYLKEIERVKLLVITGGEPFMQMPAIVTLMKRLEESQSLFDVRVQFETNGDFPLPDTMLDLYANNFTVVVSPKEPRKKNLWWTDVEKYHRIDLVIRRVVSSVESSAYHGIPEDIRKVVAHGLVDLYLSPMTVYNEDHTVNTIASNAHAHYAMQLAIDHGHKVSFQSHVYVNIR